MLRDTTAFVTTADNLKANIASPTFTGTPAAPTATAGASTTQLATTAFVAAAIANAAQLVTGTITGSDSTTVTLGFQPALVVVVGRSNGFAMIISGQTTSGSTTYGNVLLSTGSSVLAVGSSNSRVTSTGFIVGARSTYVGSAAIQDYVAFIRGGYGYDI